MLGKGQLFGRYVVEGPLGAGGMGEVYDALDTVLHRRVALKLLRPGAADAAHWAEAKARLLREARAAAALQHPHAVAIYDSGVVEDVPFIAMELVGGEPLRAYVGDRNVPWERRLRWLVDVASALAAAHSVGLVHRDVKPDNILVRPDGHVKVLDFGIARRLSRLTDDTTQPVLDGASATITGAGQVVGTPKYMPPEQISGKLLDGRADQFAWAVTAYELLAGVAPWPQHQDALAAAAAILTEAPRPLSLAAPELPLVVAQAVDRALSKLPEDRFGSMHEMIALLEPHAAPVIPPSISSPRPSVRPSSPPGIDPFGRTQVRPETTKGFTADQPTRRDRRRAPPWTLPVAGVVLLGAVVGVGLSAMTRRPAAAVASPAASSPSPSPPGPLSLLDLPRPSSTNARALARYVGGLQAQRDANGDQARAQLLEATQLDPSMGPAHLRYAIEAFFPSSDVPREHFARASQLRTGMSPYDLALLDAVEPIFDRTPPDWAEAEKKLVAAAQATPNDAELFEMLAWVRVQLGDLPGIVEADEAALKVDPAYASALQTEAITALVAGDFATVRTSADRCIAIAHEATACVHLRMYGEAHDGQCREYEQDARREIAIDPQSSDGYGHLARASLALGRPVEAAEEALSASWKRLADDGAGWAENNERFCLAAFLGDGPKTDQGLRAMLDKAEGRTEALYHVIPAWGQVLVFTEAGQLDRAAAVADDFMKRQDAWTKDPGIDGFSVSLDMVPFMLKALVRGGKMTAPEFEARRSAWVDGWRRRLSPRMAGYAWIYGYATVADTEGDAAEALAALPPYAPLPEFRPSLLADADVGHTYLLGGRIDEAIPVLRSAAGNCDVLENPVGLVKASFWLGEALEKKGDVAGACAAYGVVMKRWSSLGKRSQTAIAAGKKIASLGCKIDR